MPRSMHPDGVHIIAGDFNKVNIKTVLPKLYQHVKCPTMGENTLDQVYTNIKHAYRAVPISHLGQSDHLSLLLIPAYTPLKRRSRPCKVTVRTWPKEALDQLQDCFANTDWGLFQHQDLAAYTETVLSYIKFYIDNVTVDKCIRIFSNQKPWMNSQVCTLLRDRDAAFRTGDKALYSAARAKLRRGIKEAKDVYKNKIEHHLSGNDSRRMWQDIQNITNFRGCATTAGTNYSAQLAEELNCFFARFEATQHNTVSSLWLTPAGNTPALTLQEHEVRRVLRSVNPRKATRPDGVPGNVLRACADKLTPVCTNIFNQSLLQAIIPRCLKSATIIPIPKTSLPSSLDDYRPMALTRNHEML